MRHCFNLIFCCISLLTSAQASPSSPDWSSDTVINPTGRANPYGWDEVTLQTKIRAGLTHALNYPVSVTGFLMPEKQALKILDAKPGDSLFSLIKTALRLTSNSEFKDFKGFWNWLGLTPSPDEQYPMGVSFIQRGNIKGLTLSCTACHSSQFFGKPILGMSNRFSEANALFVHGKSATEKISAGTFALFTGANAEEKAMYADSREKMRSVGAILPQVLGLDTSLAQVALSLAKRAQTPWADLDEQSIKHPRANLLDHLVADSKPAVWWNVKYKTRWLSDGSVVSGNPILTNFLWNEIGRGTSTYDGVSIAWSIAEYLHNHGKFKPWTLFATHYHELNQLTEDFKRIKNFNVSVKELNGKVVFLRKLKEGGSEHSFGIHVAQIAGIPQTVVLRANEILHHLEKDHVKENNKQKIKEAPKNNFQLSFFDPIDTIGDEIKAHLKSLDVNTISPIEALLKLNELKRMLK